MGVKTKFMLIALAPQVVGLSLFSVGMGFAFGWGYTLAMAGGVLLFGLYFAVLILRSRRRGDERDPSADARSEPYDPWRGYNRRRWLYTLFWVYLAALLSWIDGISLGTLLCVAAALILTIDLFVYTPRMRAWAERLEAEMEPQEPASTA